MMRHENLERITRSGVVAIMRGMEASTVVQVARALRMGGIEVLEITVDAPGAIRMIEEVCKELGDEALVGAGTILDAETARAAILAGSQFLFAPSVNPEVIRMANRYARTVIPGAMTPTEIVQAFEAGAPAVKVFPAKVLGPEYLRLVRGPLAHIPMIPTGGLDATNIREFIEAGAIAVGVGGALVDRSAIEAGRFDLLAERARQVVDEVREARSALSR